MVREALFLHLLVKEEMVNHILLHGVMEEIHQAILLRQGPITILLDMGSGIMNLGDDLMKSGKGMGKNYIVLISHFYWDHIQDGAFCVPLFIGSNKFHFHGFAPAGRESSIPFERSVESVIVKQQEAPNFPVSHQAIPGLKQYHAHHFQFSESFTYYLGVVEFAREGTVWKI